MKNIIIFFIYLNTQSNATTPKFKAEISKVSSKRGKWSVTISNMLKESVFIANPDLGHVVISSPNRWPFAQS